MTPAPDSSQTGLVLSLSAYGNDSAIVSFATEKGIRSLFASHVYGKRSKLKPLLLPMAEVEVDGKETNNGLFIAREATTLFDPTLLYSSAESNSFLQLLCETGSSYFRYDDPYPLDSMRKILQALAQKKNPLSLALLSYGVLYEAMGLEEKTDGCAICGRKDNIVSYSLSEGGFFCADELRQSPEFEAKDEMDLYVLKYAFLPLDETTLNKKVPYESGRRVLMDLSYYVANYFDLPVPRSLSYFLRAIEPN